MNQTQPAIDKINDLVQLVDDIPVTSSLCIAQCFGKRHDNVIKAIRGLDVKKKWRHRNFKEIVYERENPGGAPIKTKAYRVTCDGFTLLAMGFTGKRTINGILAYAIAFRKAKIKLQTQLLYTELCKAQRALELN